MSVTKLKVLGYLKFQYPERVSAEEVASALGISVDIAYYYLERSVQERDAVVEYDTEIVDVVSYYRLDTEKKELETTLTSYEERLYPSVTDRYLMIVTRDEIMKIIRKMSELTRRVKYYRVLVMFYYRTSYAEMYYAEKPRTGKNQTPDPIAECRVTVVSDSFGRYKEALENMRSVCIQTMKNLAPQTWWSGEAAERAGKKGHVFYTITAYEDDEMIDRDELLYSVPVYGRLNYGERYAVFFKSRQRPTSEWWRMLQPEWWTTRKYPERDTDYPRGGDYEYGEKYIDEVEEAMIAKGKTYTRFNNETCRLELVR